MRPNALPTLAALLLFALSAACGSSDDPTGPSGAGGDGGEGGTGGFVDTCGEGIPAIERLEPDRGMIGDAVRIHGAHFSPEASRNQVFFNGHTSSALSVAPGCGSLETRVPANATTGPVKLIVDGVTVEGPTFTVVPVPAPHLTALSPERVPVGADAKIDLIGTDFRNGARVLLDGYEIKSRYLAPTRLQIELDAARLATEGSRTVQVLIDPPGGGASEILELLVVGQYRLLQAEAVGETAVDVRFELPPDPEAAANLSNYKIDPPLQLVSASRDAADPAVVHLVTADQGVGTRFRLSGKPELLSEEGRLLAPDDVPFRAFGSTPDQIPSIPHSGCDGFQVSGPGAITRIAGGFLLVERTGHQVQIVDDLGNPRGYLGHNGTYAGRHDQRNDDAAGCPGEDGSDADGAFRLPRGAVAQLADGDLVVADTGNGRVLRWTQTYSFRGTLGGPFAAPVVLGRYRNGVVVADADDRLHLYRDDGEWEATVGGSGDTPGAFRFRIAEGETPALASLPTTAGEPEVWFLTDPGNHRVVMFRDGEPAGILGGGVPGFRAVEGSCCDAGEAPAAFHHPRGLAWSQDQKLWVVDTAKGGRIQRFSASGEPEYEFVLGFLPGGLALGRNNLGQYWMISDPAGDRLLRFQP